MGKHFLEIICACFLCSFPIVEPAPGHTKLQLSREGLEAISRITTPISAVAVIGPYRSGKSFLLNQLLSLSCYEGASYLIYSGSAVYLLFATQH
jgi:hypothetical protein